MVAVLFEVRLRAGQEDAYLGEAARVREYLKTFPGFISVERFRSLIDPGKLISLSYWESLEAVDAWKAFDEHQHAQQMGREFVFDAYTIRVAEVLRTREFVAHP